MAILGWLSGNWFALLQTLIAVASVVAAIHTIGANTEAQKVANSFALTAAHQKLWTRFTDHPELHRVLEGRVNLETHPPTLAESRFFQGLILHLRTSFRARQSGMEFDDEAVTTDIRLLFAKPLPRRLWEEWKIFQGPDFVEFVEERFESTPDKTAEDGVAV